MRSSIPANNKKDRERYRRRGTRSSLLYQKNTNLERCGKVAKKRKKKPVEIIDKNVCV